MPDMKIARPQLQVATLVLAAVLVSGVSAALWIGHRADLAPEPMASIGGTFALASTAGGTVTDTTYRGKWELIYFGYTYCPDACPTALANMANAMSKLGPLVTNVQLLFITVDPKRDTLDVMKAYVKNFDPRLVGLTGTEKQIDDVAKKFRVYHAIYRENSDTGESSNDYVVDHSSFIYVIDPKGKFAAALGANTSGEQIADTLRSLVAPIS